MLTVTIDELCDTLGISRQAVAKLRETGVVVRIAEGKYDALETFKRYIAMQRQDAATPSLTAARVKLTESKAAIADMERRRTIGELIPAGEIERVLATAMTVFRTRMLATPTKVAARVKMASTIAEVAQLIRDEIHAALDELARGCATWQRGVDTGSAA